MQLKTNIHAFKLARGLALGNGYTNREKISVEAPYLKNFAVMVKQLEKTSK